VDIYSKYKYGDTTNAVENLHGVRRKFADKRLNFSESYECRANLAILTSYLPNWRELLFAELNMPITPFVKNFIEVTLYHF
jgi:hypothetical protein